MAGETSKSEQTNKLTHSLTNTQSRLVRLFLCGAGISFLVTGVSRFRRKSQRNTTTARFSFDFLSFSDLPECLAISGLHFSSFHSFPISTFQFHPGRARSLLFAVRMSYRHKDHDSSENICVDRKFPEPELLLQSSNDVSRCFFPFVHTVAVLS